MRRDVDRSRARSITASPTAGASSATNSIACAAFAVARRICPTWVAFARGAKRRRRRHPRRRSRRSKQPQRRLAGEDLRAWRPRRVARLGERFLRHTGPQPATHRGSARSLLFHASRSPLSAPKDPKAWKFRTGAWSPAIVQNRITQLLLVKTAIRFHTNGSIGLGAPGESETLSECSQVGNRLC